MLQTNKVPCHNTRSTIILYLFADTILKTRYYYLTLTEIAFIDSLLHKFQNQLHNDNWSGVTLHFHLQNLLLYESDLERSIAYTANNW